MIIKEEGTQIDTALQEGGIKPFPQQFKIIAIVQSFIKAPVKVILPGNKLPRPLTAG